MSEEDEEKFNEVQEDVLSILRAYSEQTGTKYWACCVWFIRL